MTPQFSSKIGDARLMPDGPVYTAHMSEAPPPFQRPNQAKSRTVLIVVIVLSCVLLPCLGVIGAGIYGWIFVRKNISPIAGCTLNFQQARDAILRYADTHAGKLPDARTWQDDVKSIYADMAKKTKQPFFDQMKPDGDWGCQIAGTDTMTGMAYNSDLSGKVLAKISDSSSTIVLFEIEKPSRNASQVYKPRPFRSSPKIFGEPRGWFVIYVDGPPRNIGAGSSFEWKQ